MSDIKSIMNLSVQTLASEQHKALKAHVLAVLANVVDIIKQEKYELIESVTCSSPSGDGYGSDNEFIDFSYNDDEDLDIYQVTQKLKSLKGASK